MIETMSEALGFFLAELDRQEVAGKTLTSYRSDLSLFAAWLTGSRGRPLPPAAITTADIREYQRYLLAVECKSPATVNRRLAALRKFFGWAAATGRVAKQPTEQVRGLGRPPRVHVAQTLSSTEADRLIGVATAEGDRRNLAILRVLRGTGLRVSELTELRLSDLRLAGRGGSLTVGRAGNAWHRVIPLEPEAATALRAYLAVRPTVADDHLFIGRRGEGIKPQAVENVVKKYARRVGLSGVTPRTFRSLLATEMLDAGINAETVAERLGHERLETTKFYRTTDASDSRSS